MLNRSSFLTVLVCMLLCTAAPLLAQNAPGQGQGQGQGGFGGQGQGGRGGRGNFDPAARAAQTLDEIKIALAASDEEWQVLRPKIEKLIAANAEVQSGNGRGGGGGRRGGGQGGPQGVAGGRGGQGADTAVSRALAELRTTLENPNAPAEQITQKLMALRDARVKSRANLDIARKDVKDLLTARQEAVLVASYGLLE